MNRLNELQEGEYASISSLHNAGGIKRRLQDLGLVEGTWVQCINRSPFGSPIAFGVRGTVIALRAEDARNIEVNTYPQPAEQTLGAAAQ